MPPHPFDHMVHYVPTITYVLPCSTPTRTACSTCFHVLSPYGWSHTPSGIHECHVSREHPSGYVISVDPLLVCSSTPLVLRALCSLHHVLHAAHVLHRTLHCVPCRMLCSTSVHMCPSVNPCILVEVDICVPHIHDVLDPHFPHGALCTHCVRMCSLAVRPHALRGVRASTCLTHGLAHAPSRYPWYPRNPGIALWPSVSIAAPAMPVRPCEGP